MNLTFQEVDQILHIIEEFPASEVHFEYGDLKLHVRRAQMDIPASVTAELSPPFASAVENGALTPAVFEPHQMEDANLTSAAFVQREGWVAVSAPMMGVYYAAPAPDAPPFVTVGQHVSENTDICIIEVMKVMNTIKSPCAGTVVEIAATNGTMVEMGSAMVWIRPDGTQGSQA